MKITKHNPRNAGLTLIEMLTVVAIIAILVGILVPVLAKQKINAKAKLVRVENPSDKGPHFRIFAGKVELGAAWQKTASARRPSGLESPEPSYGVPIETHEPAYALDPHGTEVQFDADAPLFHRVAR